MEPDRGRVGHLQALRRCYCLACFGGMGIAERMECLGGFSLSTLQFITQPFFFLFLLECCFRQVVSQHSPLQEN